MQPGHGLRQTGSLLSREYISASEARDSEGEMTPLGPGAMDHVKSGLLVGNQVGENTHTHIIGEI